MANEEHLAILRQGIEVWNQWRRQYPEIKPDLSKAYLLAKYLNKADLSNVNLNEANFIGASLIKANLSAANLIGAKFFNAFLCGANLIEANLTEADFAGANLIEVNFNGANLTEANLSETDLSGVDFRRANLSGLNLSALKLIRANLSGLNLSGFKLIGTNLNEANLSQVNLTNADINQIQALATNFAAANFTGACIQDWHINSSTNFKNVICDYIYLCQDQQERRPSSGYFAYGEFAQLFQKSLETLDLIFRNGIDWDAFAYSFKKLEVENQGAQLDVQSIEKKGDGILVVQVAVTPDADKAKIHSEFMQGYEFAAKALEAQYQARLEDKDKVINQLFSSINQLNKQLAETSGKVSIYYQPNSQFAGGIVDAINVNTEQVGGNIQNIDNQKAPG